MSTEELDQLIAKAERRAAEFGGALLILLALRSGRNIDFDQATLSYVVDGQAVPAAEVRKQLDILENKTGRTMDAYADNLQSNTWDLMRWKNEMESLIRDMHLLYGGVALGSIALAATNGIVLARTTNDLFYLTKKFVPDIKNKRVPSLLMLKRRAKSYIRSMAITHAQINHQLHILAGYNEAKRKLRANETCRDLGDFPPVVPPAPELVLKPLPKSFKYYGAEIDVKPSPDEQIGPRLAAIQDKTVREVLANPGKWVDRYLKEIDSKVINVDEAKRLFPEYEADRTANATGVHEASSLIAKAAFARRLKELQTDLNRPARVLMIGGGAAAGKSYASKSYMKASDLVYDAPMTKTSNNKAIIDQIQASNHFPSIAFVYRDHKEAAVLNLVRSTEEKRLVPLSVAGSGHYHAPRALLDGTYDYARKKGVPVVILENSMSFEKPREISLLKLKKRMYNKTQGVIESEFSKATYAEYEAHKEKYDPRAPDIFAGKQVKPVYEGSERVRQVAGVANDRRRNDRGIGARSLSGSGTPEPLPSAITYKGITVAVEPMTHLDARLSAIQDKTLREVIADPKKYVERYYKEIKDKTGKSVGRKMVNPDDTKDLFDEYKGKLRIANAQGVHEASSIVAKLVYGIRLNDLKTELKRPARVLLMGGGAGSGKTTAAGPELEKADLVFDGVLKSAKGNETLIKQLLAAGHQGQILFVFRDPKDSGASNVARSPKAGRVVPIFVGGDGHYNAPKTLIDHTYNYATENGLETRIAHNVTGQKPQYISLDQLKGLVYNSLEEVTQRFRQGAEEEYEQNKEAKDYDPRIPAALEGTSVPPTLGEDGLPELPGVGGDLGGVPQDAGVQPAGRGGDRKGSGEVKPTRRRTKAAVVNPQRGCWSYKDIWLPIDEMPPIGTLRCQQYCKCYLIYRKNISINQMEDLV